MKKKVTKKGDTEYIETENILQIKKAINKANRESLDIYFKEYEKNHYILYISGHYIYYNAKQAFVSSIEFKCKNVNLLKLSYRVTETEIIIDIPKEKGQSIINYINSLFIDKQNNNIIYEENIKKIFSINKELYKNIYILNDLIEESFFEGSTIKEQIKKDINELILKYLLLCEQEDLVFEFNKEYVRLIQEQKLLIEKNINDTISKLIKKIINLDIDKNIENIDNNLNLYLNLMK